MESDKDIGTAEWTNKTRDYLISGAESQSLHGQLDIMEGKYQSAADHFRNARYHVSFDKNLQMKYLTDENRALTLAVNDNAINKQDRQLKDREVIIFGLIVLCILIVLGWAMISYLNRSYKIMGDVADFGAD